MLFKKIIFILISVTSITFIFGQDITNHIHVDQFGYQTDATKIAVLSDPQGGFNGNESYSPGTTVELRNAINNSIIFSASPQVWNNAATHDQSLDKGWWFDFSSVSEPGSYYIFDPTNNVRSYVFRIADKMYADILQAAGRMFYYNRCNTPKATPYADPKWTDATSFMGSQQDGECPYLYDSLNTSLNKDLSGGWFDAGDYNKYVTFAYTPVHDLLTAFTESPDAFSDQWNIPESNNGIPDLLDEVKWELEWLIKMNNTDGSTIIKMGSTEHKNSASPPSTNSRSRYYGPTCTSASIAVAGMFANAAYVYDQLGIMSTFVTDLTHRAETSWNYVIEFLDNGGSLEINCDDGTINAGDADWSESLQKENLVVAAIHLWRLTGNNVYNEYVIANIDDVSSIAGWWGPYSMSANEALLIYYNLPGADETTRNTIINSLLPHVQQDWNGIFRNE